MVRLTGVADEVRDVGSVGTAVPVQVLDPVAARGHTQTCHAEHPDQNSSRRGVATGLKIELCQEVGRKAPTLYVATSTKTGSCGVSIRFWIAWLQVSV